MGPQEAERKEAVKTRGAQSALLQEAYRHFTLHNEALPKSLGRSTRTCGPSPKHCSHMSMTTTRKHSMQACMMPSKQATHRSVYLIRAKVELNDILKTVEQSKGQHRRAARASANKGFADKTHVLKRSSAAASAPTATTYMHQPQSPTMFYT